MGNVPLHCQAGGFCVQAWEALPWTPNQECGVPTRGLSTTQRQSPVDGGGTWRSFLFSARPHNSTFHLTHRSDLLFSQKPPLIASTHKEFLILDRKLPLHTDVYLGHHFLSSSLFPLKATSHLIIYVAQFVLLQTGRLLCWHYIWYYKQHWREY